MAEWEYFYGHCQCMSDDGETGLHGQLERSTAHNVWGVGLWNSPSVSIVWGASLLDFFGIRLLSSIRGRNEKAMSQGKRLGWTPIWYTAHSWALRAMQKKIFLESSLHMCCGFRLSAGFLSITGGRWTVMATSLQLLSTLSSH